VAEVVIERAARHARPTNHLFGPRTSVPVLGKEATRGTDQRVAGRGGMLRLTALALHSICMSNTFCMSFDIGECQASGGVSHEHLSLLVRDAGRHCDGEAKGNGRQGTDPWRGLHGRRAAMR